jgi:hypothetical protein
MIRIDRLPDEIILNILFRGCEDTKNLDSRRYSRRRKPFICLTRSVCRRWKCLADLPSYHSFWSAHLVLTLKRERRTPFAKQLSLFQWMLQTSQGCDLIITFNIMDWGIKALDAVESLATSEAIYLNLFLYGMETVLSFKQQILALSIGSHLPQISRFALELLTKMNPAPRLTYLHLDLPSQTFRGIQQRHPMLNRQLGLRGCVPESNHISLSHLRYLEHVAIGSNTCELSRYIPTSITHLEVMYVCNYPRSAYCSSNFLTDSG